MENAIKKSKIVDKTGAYRKYLSTVTGKSNGEAREVAADILGENVYWDCDRR